MLKVACVVQRLGLHVDGFHEVLVHIEDLLGRVQGQRPVPHQQEALSLRSLGNLYQKDNLEDLFSSF